MPQGEYQSAQGILGPLSKLDDHPEGEVKLVSEPVSNKTLLCNSRSES